jgi:hypothetical protein
LALILVSQAGGAAISPHLLDKLLCAAGFVAIAAAPICAAAEPVPVSYKQGSLHGFLLLKNRAGKVIAVGDQTNVARGNEIHAELVFHFRDGSLDDEVTDYREGEVFQLIRDHHIQKGPSFPKPLDMTIDVSAGTVTWQQTKDGRSDTKTQHLDLPNDLVNGMMQIVAENFPPKAEERKVSYLVANPGPRIVTFSFKQQGEDRVRVGGAARRANRYIIHIEIGGLAGVVAPIVGKKPADMQMWAISGDAPLFIGMRGALYPEGPVWTMELTSPTLPPGSPATAGK